MLNRRSKKIRSWEIPGEPSLGNIQAESFSPEEAEEIQIVGAVVEEDLECDPGRIKIDLHCHTEASKDCKIPIELFPKLLRDRQVRVQAITDHNEIWGAVKLKELIENNSNNEKISITVIVGEEISTKNGELIGIFLQERIEPGLSVDEIVERIQEQDGLVLLPHGFDPFKRWRLRTEARRRIAKDIDIVETFNAHVSRPYFNHRAVKWALKHSVIMSAGSDAHTVPKVGNAWVEVPIQLIQNPQDLLMALQEGEPTGIWSNPIFAYIYRIWSHYVHKKRAK